MLEDILKLNQQPTLASIHIVRSHKPTHKPKPDKEYGSSHRLGDRTNRNGENTKT